MPKLALQFRGKEVSCDLRKVDRAKLYGSVSLEALDEDGQVCELATLADDGKTLIPAGGTAFAYISVNGEYCDRSELKPVDLEGNEIEAVSSTFKAPVSLSETATVEDYLSHSIRIVYGLDAEGGFDDALLEELSAGTIFTFPFSYRGGLQADAGFLFRGADGTIWLAVGQRGEIRFVGLDEMGVSASLPEDEDEESSAVDLMDFGAM